MHGRLFLFFRKNKRKMRKINHPFRPFGNGDCLYPQKVLLNLMKKEYWNVFDRATPVGCAGGTVAIPADDNRAADGYIN